MKLLIELYELDLERNRANSTRERGRR